MSRIAVMGSGAWGTALAISLARRGGHEVALWSYAKDVAATMREQRENTAFLPGFQIPESVAIFDDAAESLEGAEIVVSVTPSQFVRSSYEQFAFRDAEGTEPEMAADVIDLVKTFQQILERAKNRPSLQFDEDAVTVAQMIDYVRRRLMVEDRPIRLKQLLRHLRARPALVCAFLAILEMIRLQAVICRQDDVFGEVVLKKSDRL